MQKRLGMLLAVTVLVGLCAAPRLARAQTAPSTEIVSLTSFDVTPRGGLPSFYTLLGSVGGKRLALKGIYLWLESDTFTGTPVLSSFKFIEVMLQSAGGATRINRDMTPRMRLTSMCTTCLDVNSPRSFSLPLLEPGLTVATGQIRDRLVFYYLASVNSDIGIEVWGLPATGWKALVWSKALTP